AAAAQQQQPEARGGGWLRVNGLCTAWQLLERGHRVTLLEQFPVPHSRGSSHGHSRITRYAYKEAEYARLMRRAFRCGAALRASAASDSSSTAAWRPWGRVLESNSMPLERLSGQSLASRFPRLAGFRDCVLDPSAGILLADRCLQTLRSRVAQLWWSPPRLRPRDGHRAAARRLRPASPFGQRDGGCGVCRGAHGGLGGSGGWCVGGPAAVGPRPGPAAAAIGVTAMYWRLRRADGRCVTRDFRPEKFPTFVYEDEKLHVYGLPELESACTTGRTWTRTSGTREQREPYYLPELADFVKRWFPDLVPEPAVTEKCIYTLTPDSGLIVDRHPSHRNIVFVCGCSGHGFKLGPAIGQLLSEMANRPATQPGFGLHVGRPILNTVSLRPSFELQVSEMILFMVLIRMF
uniref:Sarcosine oxidasee (formaldehyde-forming) n=1 Tax=Macrostomum lignano TaxID=282301 RepID=A0A1I8FNA6_9PLAT